MKRATRELIDVGLAHLGRFAFVTRDNPFLLSTAGLGLRPSQAVTLGRLLEGTLSAKTWLSTPEADQLLRKIRIGCVPRDVQLVTRDGQPTVGAESVHAFLHAPLFWWLVSNLWCISIGRLLDPELGDNIKGYRLHPQFIDDPAHYGVMFRNKNDSYDDWKDFASASAADLPGQTRAVSTLDIRDFYYSITTTPSTITSAFAHSLYVAPVIPQTTAALTHLLDAVHHQFAKRFSALRSRGDNVQNPIPLPVGLPSSQVLANLVIALGVADLEAKPEIDSVAAYADDLMVISRSLPEMEEDSAEYLARLQVVDPESHELQSPSTSPLATLYARLDKSATFYLRSSPGDGLASDEPDEGTTLDPYLEGEPSPEWGGRLRTVLRAPHKRDRVPRELTSDIRRLVDEIRIGLAPEEAQGRVVAIIDELDDAMFLALRPYWTDLLVAAIAALGSKAAIELTDEFVKVAESLAPPRHSNAATRKALYFGLRASWIQALAHALAVSLSQFEREIFELGAPLLISDSLVGELSTHTVVLYAKRLRDRRVVDAAFVAVPLSEFTDWSGRLIGHGAFEEFIGWHRDAESHQVSLADRLPLAVRFIAVHEVCLALHLWASVGVKNWLDRAFSILGKQPLVHIASLDDLHERAGLILTPPEPKVPQSEEDRAELLMRFAMPSIMVSGDQLRALIDGDQAALGAIASQARKYTTRILLTSLKCKADVLVLPEWAVLAEMLPWVMERAAAGQMLVVTGQAPRIHADKYTNVVWTGIPLRDSLGHRACLVPPPRQKKFLSPQERRLLSEGDIEPSPSRGRVPSYYWRGLTIASLLCFEFSDIAIRQSLRDTADILTVSSWNRDWRYFDAIQESTTRDNYCLTICVNTGAYPGTKIMRPTVSEKAVVASVHGSQEPALVSRTLDMVPIVAARAKGEAPSEFLVDEPTDDAELSDYKPLPPS